FDIRRLDVVEGEVAAFLVTEFGHPPEKVGVDRRVPGLNADKSEPRHLRLLRARRERPRRCAAQQRDERAAPHAYHRAFLPLAKSRRRGLTTGEGPRRIMRVPPLAAAFGARLLRWCGAQEAWP